MFAVCIGVNRRSGAHGTGRHIYAQQTRSVRVVTVQDGTKRATIRSGAYAAAQEYRELMVDLQVQLHELRYANSKDS